MRPWRRRGRATGEEVDPTDQVWQYRGSVAGFRQWLRDMSEAPAQSGARAEAEPSDPILSGSPDGRKGGQTPVPPATLSLHQTPRGVLTAVTVQGLEVHGSEPAPGYATLGFLGSPVALRALANALAVAARIQEGPA